MLGFATLSSGILFNVHMYVMMILLLYKSSNSKLMLNNLHFSHNIASAFVYFCSTDEKISTAHLRATQQWCFVTEWITFWMNRLSGWINDLLINRFTWFFPELIHQIVWVNDSNESLIKKAPCHHLLAYQSAEIVSEKINNLIFVPKVSQWNKDFFF